MPTAEKNSISSSSGCSLATRPRRRRVAETAADNRACDQAARRRPLASASEGLVDAPARCAPAAGGVDTRVLGSPSPPCGSRLDDTDPACATSVRTPSPVGPAVGSRFTLPPFVEPGERMLAVQTGSVRASTVVARTAAGGLTTSRQGSPLQELVGPSWLSLPVACAALQSFRVLRASASGTLGHVRSASLPVIGNRS
jgi:hypothetical protein